MFGSSVFSFLKSSPWQIAVARWFLSRDDTFPWSRLLLGNMRGWVQNNNHELYPHIHSRCPHVVCHPKSLPKNTEQRLVTTLVTSKWCFTRVLGCCNHLSFWEPLAPLWVESCQLRECSWHFPELRVRYKQPKSNLSQMFRSSPARNSSSTSNRVVHCPMKFKDDGPSIGWMIRWS